MTLSNSQIDALRIPIAKTWQHISWDAPPDVTNTQAIELALDAGRLTTVSAAPWADSEVAALVELHGYAAVLHDLERAITLVD